MLTARCGICFKHNAQCKPISYPSIDEVFKLCNLKPIAVATCLECLEHKDPQELYQSIADFVVIDQMWAFLTGERASIIKNKEAFEIWRNEAQANGVFKREFARQAGIGNVENQMFLKGLMQAKSIDLTGKSDFHTELLMKAMFKKSHEKN